MTTAPLPRTLMQTRQMRACWLARRPLTLLAVVLGLGATATAQAQTLMLVAPAVDVGAQRSMQDRFDAAMQDYERSHWAQAFEAFVQLGAEGQAEAANVALLMHRFGPGLYGQHFALTALQRQTLAQVSQRLPSVTARSTP